MVKQWTQLTSPIYDTRSLGALWAPTSGFFNLSFPPFGRSVRRGTLGVRRRRRNLQQFSLSFEVVMSFASKNLFSVDKTLSSYSFVPRHVLRYFWFCDCGHHCCQLFIDLFHFHETEFWHHILNIYEPVFRGTRRPSFDAKPCSLLKWNCYIWVYE